jgi:hypothetical protein
VSDPSRRLYVRAPDEFWDATEAEQEAWVRAHIEELLDSEEPSDG